MAKLPAALFFIISVFLVITQQGSNAQFGREKLTRLDFYMRPNGPDGPTVTVASNPNVTRPPNLFGLTNVVDYALTTGPSPSSPPFGRAHGMFVSSSSLNDTSFFVGITAVFSTGAYNGSQLNIIGYDSIQIPTREMSVTGGTRYFRFARGYVNVSDYHGIPNVTYPIIRLQMTILHHWSSDACIDQ